MCIKTMPSKQYIRKFRGVLLVSWRKLLQESTVVVVVVLQKCNTGKHIHDPVRLGNLLTKARVRDVVHSQKKHCHYSATCCYFCFLPKRKKENGELKAFVYQTIFFFNFLIYFPDTVTPINSRTKSWPQDLVHLHLYLYACGYGLSFILILWTTTSRLLQHLTWYIIIFFLLFYYFYVDIYIYNYYYFHSFDSFGVIVEVFVNHPNSYTPPPLPLLFCA
jgi:hypothetical protein